MIETPHPLHTLLHTYKVFLYLLLWVWFIRSNPNLILLGLAYHSHRGSLGFSLCNAVAMIAESNPLHTHIRSNYKVLHHLLQWLVVIWMRPQPDICLVSQHSGSRWRVSWFLTCNVLLVLMIGKTCPLHTHRWSTLYIYTKCFSTCYSGYRL
jgi:hypothetical protein